MSRRLCPTVPVHVDQSKRERKERKVAAEQDSVPPAKHLVWPDLGCDCGWEQQAQFPPVLLPDSAPLAEQAATDGAGLLRRLAALAA